ncbi:MAG: BON domain-containing protein [Cyanobacteria bacterium]|nr:BON domain-containing protein [Cyanobacteriota bacterium]
MYNRDRYSRDEYSRWRRYGQERGWVEKTKDEISSWFGDEDAELRRRRDREEEEWNDRERGGRGSYSDYGYGSSSSYSQYRPNDRQRHGWQDYESDVYNREQRDVLGRSYQNPRDREYSGMANPLSPYYGVDRFSYRKQQLDKVRRNPRNYKRSDERISDDIHERIDRHLDLDAREVDIIVSNGEVTIKGTVQDREDKRLIEEVAEDVFGVKNVQNLLRVTPSEYQEIGALSSSTSTTGKSL